MKKRREGEARLPGRLRVLLIEDSEHDAELTLRALQQSGYHLYVERIETPEEMREALRMKAWDVIVSDYTLPRFSAPDAFAILRETDIDVPFIIVSGTVGEETAVAAMKLGVHDYLLKGKLTRLVPAMERELRDCHERHARRRAEAESLTSEARYRASESRYRTLFEASPLPMWVFDVETLEFLAVNEAAVAHYGYARDEFEHLTLEDIREPLGEEETQRHRKKDGSVVLVELRAHDMDFEGRHARLEIVHDVTDRVRAQEELRRTEEQLRQAQRMEAVGRFAGGVAHDFNNILSVILSYSDMMLESLPAADRMRDDVEEVRRAGRRGANLTRQLLMFSRQQVVEPKVLDVNQVIAGLENMVRRLLGADVELTMVLSSTAGRVWADAGQIEQVVMNLVVNARDAMPVGGKLEIETKIVVLDEDEARQHIDVRPGAYVVIAVTDTGSGMDEATQSHVFEPFFTTKEKGKGTGLGLSTVFGIVRRAGGHVTLESAPGQGASFRIFLPRTDALEGQPSTPPPLEPETGTETILLVEDDDQLRTVTRGILQRLGYRVIEAPNAGEALLVCEENSQPIHLLLSDVVLPRMSGKALADRLAATHPETRVLLMSGYTDEAIVPHGVHESGVAFLQKPITPESIARKVREVLGPAGGSPGSSSAS